MSSILTGMLDILKHLLKSIWKFFSPQLGKSIILLLIKELMEFAFKDIL
jgi:hypothetical protein